jgi:hypothetical protein
METKMTDNPTQVWGVINADGTKASGNGFVVLLQSPGQYEIVFEPPFRLVPAIVGSTTNSKNTSEYPSNNVVFPLVSEAMATACTGFYTSKANLAFSFIATGVR